MSGTAAAAFLSGRDSMYVEMNDADRRKLPLGPRRDRVGRQISAAALPILSAATLCAIALAATIGAQSDPGGSRGPAAAAEGELSNDAFQIRYDAAGVRSLKRANDRYDTEYISAGGALGPLRVRYRTAPHADWRELGEMVMRPPSGGRTIEYVLAATPPALTDRVSPSAERGVGGLRALNDGLVPAASGGSGAAQAVLPAPVPTFVWTHARNEPGGGGPGDAAPARWVQYTFPVEELVDSVAVFWVAPPVRWRLLSQTDQEWRQVDARSDYGVEPNRFVRVEFAPVRTIALRLEVVMPQDSAVSLAEWRVGADPRPVPPAELEVVQRFTLDPDALGWSISLANRADRPVEVGDLAVPLDAAERVARPADIYTSKLIRHALVAGHGSWVYWSRSNGEGPYLLMATAGRTKFEYFDSSGGGRRPGAFTPYVYAKAAAAAARAAGGDWRLPVTSLTLAPGESRTYTFRFRWVENLAAVRDALVAEGEVDVSVAPGMVLPSDLTAMVALRTRSRIAAVTPEDPSQTNVRFVGEASGGTKVYRLQFSRLGENLVTVRYGEDEWLTLEFFVTEPLETVIRKRAAFLVSHHQHRDAAKWYVGAYGDWDQKNEVLRGPEDRDGLSTWLTDANDDAGNARPAFIASKNVFFPNQKEIESLELYITKYLWGGMQMTEGERYPYAIYGIPNWKANRASADPGRNGRAHVWRIYDYPHIVMLYYRMYQIARFYPALVTHLDAPRYLERAYRTAVSYWTVPVEIEKWPADAVGTMNEAFLPELIAALEEEEKPDWAATLRRFWEGKVARFVNDTPNLYTSEFAFDSTGFESTGAFARYAMTRESPEFRSHVSKAAAGRFMERQLLLNVTDRGTIETTYYQLGTDYRGSMTYLLSYMSQMGGWAILDYALHFAPDPTDYLRLGYASALSSWALVNSGTAESGYGYWFPSRNNDGATGGGFMPEASGRAWIGKTVRRGAWHYSAEQDVGFCGALRSHATVVTRDPVFGDLAYGGVLTREGDRVRVIPRDGLRVRFHVVRGDQRLHLTLDHDGFARELPVVVLDDLSAVDFTLENRTGPAHATRLDVSGLPAGDYAVSLDGSNVATIRGAPTAQSVTLRVGTAARARIRIARAR